MADFNLVADKSTSPTTELNPNTSTGELEIIAVPENVVKGIIPSSTTDTPTGAYIQLFNTLIKYGTAEPSSITDLRCRIYIKIDA